MQKRDLFFYDAYVNFARMTAFFGVLGVCSVGGRAVLLCEKKQEVEENAKKAPPKSKKEWKKVKKKLEKKENCVDIGFFM